MLGRKCSHEVWLQDGGAEGGEHTKTVTAFNATNSREDPLAYALKRRASLATKSFPAWPYGTMK